jgi:class 3 adenylate cyclase
VLEHSARKLAVILHADVVDSTGLVRTDETMAHERIRDAFHRFAKTIDTYGGVTQELRGDALVAQFERASDAVSAALVFQAQNTAFNATLDDDLRPRLRTGISMGEVVVADDTITGEGVVLAQRIEQLADPGGVCITAAVHEALPGRLPFDQEDIGKQTLKGFDDAVQVHRVALRPGGSIPPPQQIRQSGTSGRSRRLIVAGAAVVLLVLAGTTYWFASRQSEETPWTTRFPADTAGRGFARAGVKMGRINLRLEIPPRWDPRIIEEEDLNLQGFETSPEQVQYEFARQLDGTINPLVLVATDREDAAHFRVFKLHKYIPPNTNEAADRWMQDRGVRLIIDRYAGTTDYVESRGRVKAGTLGSGEKITMIPSVLRINEATRHVWTIYALRPNSSNALYGYVVFFFHNGSNASEIHEDLLLEITNYSTKMFR